MKEPVYKRLASSVDAYARCAEKGNAEWRVKHRETIEQLVLNRLPHGSGFDNGCTFDFDASTGEKLVIHTSYHHMNDVGMYDGWTEHTVIVKASLVHGIVLRITGRDRREIKDYIHEIFQCSLTEIVD
ncbi:MAG: hypothetical protein WC683_02765 [bacterium]